jgi:hypothetical protein
MAKPDLVTDVTRACRLAKRVFFGEMSVTDVILNRNPQMRAEEGQAKCVKTEGCIGPLDHEGGCILEGQEDKSQEKEAAKDESSG